MNDEEQKRIFSRNLRRYVDSSGKQQKDICKQLGINPTTFNMWIKGNTIPNVSKIQMLADYFHIGKSDLVDDKSDAPEYDPRIMELIDIFSKVDDASKDVIMATARAIYSNMKKESND